MLKLSWFWRGKATNVRTRTFTFAFSSLAYIAAFAVAGIFSSKIASNNSEVLLVPIQTCGIWPYPWSDVPNPDIPSWQDWSIQRLSYWSNFFALMRESHTYVAQCYNSSIDEPTEACLPHGKNRISWTTNTMVKCPFEDMCVADAIQFDTGFLSSQNHFGINVKDDIEYRRVMTCAPIKTDGYVTDYVSELDLSENADQVVLEGDTWLKYTYGGSYYFNDNTTYAYSNFSWGSPFAVSAGIDIYQVDAEFSCANPDEVALSLPTFEAIPSLQREDADTTLVFLTINASYFTEVNDPWFRATKLTVVDGLSGAKGSNDSIFTYSRDAPVNVVACAEQHQFRNPETEATSRLGGQELLVNEQIALLFNENQQLLYNRSFFIGGDTILSAVVSALGGNLLLAADTQTYYTQSVGLPDNQWQLEFNHYFGIGLNTIQLWTLQYATGISDPAMNKYVVPATEGLLKEMCNNQIVRRADYRSFSVLGLCIVLIVGILFVLLNLTTGLVVQRVQGHTMKGRYRNAEWQANDFLQLQRMAYEHKDIGTWEGQNEMVPRTSPGEVFTLPETTKWNEETPRAPQTGRGGLTQIWSRARKADKSQPPVSDSPGSSLKEKPVRSETEITKDVQISETQLRT